MKKERFIWPLVSCMILVIGLFVCRYLLFRLHGMREYPWMLAGMGLLVIIIAAGIDSRKLMLCAALGYSASFALAMLLQNDGVDPGGGTTNNGWIIWGATYIVSILGGSIAYIIKRRSQK